MNTVEHIAAVRTTNKKGIALFVKRAQAQLGQAAEGNGCPFFLAGRVAREFGGDTAASTLLFRSLSDVGTPRARRAKGWQL